MDISEDYRIELLQALAARKNTPKDVQDLKPIGRPKGHKSPGSGIPKGVRVYDSNRQLIGEWNSLREASDEMNTPGHRIKVACQRQSKFYNMERVIFYAEYFELPKKSVER